MSLFKKIKHYIKVRKDPIGAARDMGVEVGENCRFIGMPSFSSEPYLVSIGDHVTLASYCSFIPHDGGVWCFRFDPGYEHVLKFGRITVGNNCFIGYRATILAGVTIGDNSIIGACSLVTKDVPPNSVYAGVPAKFICTLEEYKQKCLANTPEHDHEYLLKNKQKELERLYPKVKK